MNSWAPEADFKFPPSGKRNLKFQFSWLASYPWLTYSVSEDGAYCRACVTFAQDCVGKGNHQRLNLLVQTEFREWKRALEKFKEHQSKSYHKDAMEYVQNFKLIYENKKDDVISELNQSRKRQQADNRQKLYPIIRAILLCGRQGLALRGHRDHGPISLKTPEENDGNFRALLRFAVESGDHILQQHLISAGMNATYMSGRIQNEVIEAAGKIIMTAIVNRINKSGCFASIAAETTDVTGIEQFSVCVRYVDHIENEYKIREDFLCFTPVTDVTGNGLAKTLLATLNSLGVNISCMKGQG